MRYQELIYIQNSNSAVRNKDILNVNMSSDICIFSNPQFSISGASKIDCSLITGTTYVLSSDKKTLPVEFEFTANTDSFTANNATFRYEIYKYDNLSSAFTPTAVYKSSSYTYSEINISGDSILREFIPLNELNLDGEYLVKGYYVFDMCTDFSKRLGKTVDTKNYRNGTKYGLYDKTSDYYFMAMWEAEKPILLTSASNTPENGKLFQQVIIPKVGTKTFPVNFGVSGNFIVTLNGLVLADKQDYIVNDRLVTLSAATIEEDIITVIYTTSGGYNFISENIDVDTEIVSGTTNNEGSNRVYFNTTTGKYEVYSKAEAQDNGSVLIMVNGVVLSYGVDFYQSTTNTKRFILEGSIVRGDIITIAYFPKVTVIDSLMTNNPMITWVINTPPQTNYGNFTLEVSTGSSFSTIYTSTTVQYVVNQLFYSSNFIVSGPIGTKYFYRVKNDKKFTTLCGNVIIDTKYSDIIPMVVVTNAINSY